MTSRPRRSAAAKASETIAVQTRLADESEKRENNPAFRRSGRGSDIMPGDSRRTLTVKVGAGGANGARGEQFEGGEIVHGTRNRGGRKNYVVASSPDDDDDEEEEPELDDDEEEEVEGSMGEEINMDVDADGEEDEDAEGDIDMDAPKSRPTIKVSRPRKGSNAAKKSNFVEEEEDDDDLSDPGESDGEDRTMNLGEDEDAEGEEIEVAGGDDEEDEDEEDEEDEEDDEEVGEDEEEDAEGEVDEDAEAEPDEEAGVGVDSDEEGSLSQSLDKSKMTKRQRARFEDEPHEFMKLPDEVQPKKHFTAEELSMRRQEMARRRRNLSEKRNEEVKMETINKLLKKQAPKMNRKAAAQAAAAANEEASGEFEKPSPIMVRYVSNKSGSKVAVPSEMLEGPTGKVFIKGGLSSGKMVEEVA